MTYHPNGDIMEFTYGNGIKHTLTQNARGLPDTSCDFYGSCNASAFLNDGYDYDPNGNVAAISDGRTGSHGNRTMTYDALDRLTQVVSGNGTLNRMFGTATYAYDVLDNLTRVHVTGGNQPRNHYYCYDAKWQLTNVKMNCPGFSSHFQAVHYGNLRVVPTSGSGSFVRQQCVRAMQSGKRDQECLGIG